VKRLLVFLTDPLKAFYEKGEIKARYYNPENVFSEVHFISPITRDVDPQEVQELVGNAKLTIHAVGPRYYLTAGLPFGSVAKILETVQPHVIRAYDPAIRGSLAVYWGRRLHLPTLISVHADLDEQRSHEKRFLHFVRVLFEGYCLPRATDVLCVTRHVERYAHRWGVTTERTHVIYNRVSGERFEQSVKRLHPLDERASALSILTVGRLISQKYQACLIRAVARLDATLTVIGDGILRESLERLVDELQIRQQVRFIRAVPHQEIARYYAAADVFAMATHYEGFCIPVLEAMSAGLPVVASKIPPLMEIVGDTGQLVDNDPEAFAFALQRLIDDSSLRNEMGMMARQRAVTLDGSVMEQREAQLYQALMKTTEESPNDVH